MLHPRPSDHAASLLPRGLPLALGATAVSLALVGCSYLPESLGGSAEGNSPEEQSEGGEQTEEEVMNDPTDAESSIQAAVEHIETASDYHVTIRQEHESGESFRSHGGAQRYTSTPEEVVHSYLGGEGASSVVYYSNSELSLWSIGDGLLAEVVDPTPADEFNTDPSVGGVILSQILETSTDLAHTGEGEVEVRYNVENLDTEAGYDRIEETVPAYSYSGTFTSVVSEISTNVPVGDYGFELAEYPDVPFTLWLDEEGVPVQVEHTSGEHTHTHTFISVNEDLELTMPGPGQLANP